MTWTSNKFFGIEHWSISSSKNTTFLRPNTILSEGKKKLSESYVTVWSKIDEKHNSSIDMDFDNKKELIRIS